VRLGREVSLIWRKKRRPFKKAADGIFDGIDESSF
jgi:hypothetical protein